LLTIPRWFARHWRSAVPDPAIEVIGTACDPFVAAERMREQVPDVITLDIEMPRMDGLTFLQKIMSQHPIPVVICSSLAEEGAQSTLKALEYGAVDIIAKPRLGTKTVPGGVARDPLRGRQGGSGISRARLPGRRP
jgi:chemotaxis response regulator CheB